MDADADAEAVLTANLGFYEAFEARDIDALSDLWEHGDRVSCTHPGWRTLYGWTAVGRSWAALLANGQDLQFIVTEAHAVVQGDTAWVTCEENLLGLDNAGAVAAVNLFTRTPAGWRLVGHHGSPIAR